MSAALATVLAASLLGSAHCVGMCGGLVTFYAGTDRANGRQQAISHVLYHSGRLLAYVTLGAVAGGVGHAVNLAGGLAGWQSTMAMVAGVTMVGWGGLALARACGLPMPAALHRTPVPARLQQAFAKGLSALRAQSPAIRAGGLGLVTALLPCGWLYAFVMTAAGMGSAAHGAVAMAAFWLGTLPLLVGLGIGVQQLAGPLRVHLPKVTAVALVVVGVIAVTQRASLIQPANANSPAACCHAP